MDQMIQVVQIPKPFWEAVWWYAQPILFLLALLLCVAGAAGVGAYSACKSALREWDEEGEE